MSHNNRAWGWSEKGFFFRGQSLPGLTEALPLLSSDEGGRGLATGDRKSRDWATGRGITFGHFLFSQLSLGSDYTLASPDTGRDGEADWVRNTVISSQWE